MTNHIRNYKIHNFLEFKIINNTHFPKQILENIYCEYENFQVETIKNPDITIILGKFIPSIEGCKILDNKYYVKEEYLFYKESHKSAKWMFEFNGIDNKHITIHIDFNAPASLIISDFVINIALFMKLNDVGCSFIHGAAIDKNNNGYILSGQGGSGKTTTALYSIENGFNFLGDNFILLSKNKIFSFLTPLNIFSFNFHSLVKSNIDQKKKIEYNLKNILSKFTGINIVTKINPKIVFKNSITTNSNLEKIFVMLPQNNWECSKIQKEIAIKHLLFNMKIDFAPIIKPILMYSYVYPKSNLARFWEVYEKNLDDNLTKHIDYHLVITPIKYNRDVFTKYLEAIQND